VDLTLRPARPWDVDAAVPLIYSSGPAAFEYVFTHAARGSATEFLHRAFTVRGGEFGYGNHTVAEIDGEVVGVGAAFSGAGLLASTITTGFAMIRFYHSGSVGPVGRGLRVERLFAPPAKDTQYIAHLGVAPEVRGHGVGTALVALFLVEGHRAGKARAALDVSVENPDAERLYERLGFTVEREVASTLSNEFGAVPDHRRMVLPLA
jgi:ribosomal protein S18 acetylase RimI-like enzyme